MSIVTVDNMINAVAIGILFLVLLGCFLRRWYVLATRREPFDLSSEV
jgi:hypothetical protein